MPNAKISAQDQEAAAKRYAKYGKQIEAYNSGIEVMNADNQKLSDAYQVQVDRYNQMLAEFDATKSALRPGSIIRDQTGALMEINNVGTPVPATNIFGSAAAQYDTSRYEYDPATKEVYIKKSAEDIAREAAIPSQTVYDMNGKPMTFKSSYTPSWVTNGGQVAVTSGDRYLVGSYAAPTTYGDVREFIMPGAMSAAPNYAVPPPAPEEPKGWNPSLAELDNMANPQVDMAGAEAAAAAGKAVNTGIIGETAARSDQLADPNDQPLTSNKGILARVLGGEL